MNLSHNNKLSSTLDLSWCYCMCIESLEYTAIPSVYYLYHVLGVHCCYFIQSQPLNL